VQSIKTTQTARRFARNSPARLALLTFLAQYGQTQAFFLGHIFISPDEKTLSNIED
jgi:hypothetical protein